MFADIDSTDFRHGAGGGISSRAMFNINTIPFVKTNTTNNLTTP